MKRKDSEKQKHWRGYEDFDKDVQTLPELSQLLEYHYLESRLAKAIDPKKNAAWVKATHKDHQRAQKRFMKLSRDKWEMAKRAGWIKKTPTGVKLPTTMFTDFDGYAVGIAKRLRKENPALPPVPAKLDDLQNWCIDAKAKLDAEPLSKNARLIYEKLKSLPKHEAMTRTEILDWLGDKHEVYMDEGTFNKKRKELLPYGLKNKPRIGYWFPK